MADEATNAADADTKEWEIVAQDTDNAHDAGFNVKFDRPYAITEERPITEDAAVRAVEDAYDWQLGEGVERTDLPEGGRVGYLVTDTEGTYIETYWEPDAAVKEVLDR